MEHLAQLILGMTIEEVFQFYGQYLPIAQTLQSAQQSQFHCDYQFTVEHAHDLAIHALKEEPTKILNSYRPGEDEAIKKYRCEAYKCPTYYAWCKVENILSRIKEAEDFRIDFNVTEKNSLYEYTEGNLPFTDTIKEWLFRIALKVMLRDPNAVMVVLPDEMEVVLGQTEYRTVFPYIFESKNVVLYEERRICITRDDNFFWIITNTQISKHKIDPQTNIIDAGTILVSYQMDNIPAERLGGSLVTKNHNPRSPIYTSFVAGVLPSWDKAVRLSSDFDACIVLHAFPQRQSIRQQSQNQSVCTTCNGKREIKREDEGQIYYSTCTSCSGTGYTVGKNDPFKEQTITIPEGFNATEQQFNLKLPISMYTTPDINSPKFLEEVRDREIDKGFASINMEFLAKVGANQSGVAKEYDRTDLNTMLEQVAGKLVYLANQAYYYINAVRHPVEMKTRAIDWTDWLPSITVPKSFDRITSMTALNDLAAAKAAGAGPATIQALEERVENAQFRGNMHRLAYLQTLREMAPLPGLSEDAITMGQADGTIRKQDAYLQNNIQRLIREAETVNKEFYTLDFKAKQDQLYALIQAEMNVNDGLNADGTDPSQVETVNVGGSPTDVVDIEAEAQARLRGTVGAFEGTTSVAKAIAEGLFSLEAGITQLTEFLGIDEATARKMLDGAGRQQVDPNLGQ